MPNDLLYIHAPGDRRTAAEWRAFRRWARRRGYGRIIALPDNRRGDLSFPSPGVVVSPGVITAPSTRKEIAP
jgi:hypothetical protein